MAIKKSRSNQEAGFRNFVDCNRCAGDGRSLGRCRLDYVDLAVELIESDTAIFQGKEGVVAPHADICSRVEASAALADDDVSGNNDLAAKFLYAEPF
jgi:hypothetical protein